MDLVIGAFYQNDPSISGKNSDCGIFCITSSDTEGLYYLCNRIEADAWVLASNPQFQKCHCQVPQFLQVHGSQFL